MCVRAVVCVESVHRGVSVYVFTKNALSVTLRNTEFVTVTLRGKLQSAEYTYGVLFELSK